MSTDHAEKLAEALEKIATGEYDDLDPDDGLHGTSARAIAREALAAYRASKAAAQDGWQPTHRHYKGGLYRVIGTGRLEANLELMVVYQAKDGTIWVRPEGDFNFPGKFEPLPPPPAKVIGL